MPWREYPEGHFKPERGANHPWNVWCSTGALQVLKMREYMSFLENNPERTYTINFANAAIARIHPGHPLWVELQDIAQQYAVAVYPLNLSGKYVPWSGEAGSLSAFDAIVISVKPEAASAAQS
jgi:hypothetical protein